MTIENKTSFQRMDDETFSYLYLGGFANRHQIAFLKKVIEDDTELENFIELLGFSEATISPTYCEQVI